MGDVLASSCVSVVDVAIYGSVFDSVRYESLINTNQSFDMCNRDTPIKKIYSEPLFLLNTYLRI